MKNLINLFCILLLSCKTSVSDNNNAQIIQVNTEKMDSVHELFESYTYLALETTQDNIISNIDKIQLYDDIIYLLDRKYKTVYLFDKDGKFINKIAHFGRGSNEYLSLDDFQVHNDKVFILSRVNKTIYMFSKMGRFIKKNIINDWYSNFFVVDDDNLILYSEDSNNKMNNFIYYNYSNNSYSSEFDKFEENYGCSFLQTPFHMTKDNGLLISKQFDCNIYSINKDSMSAIYNIEFVTKDKMPKNHKKISKLDLREKLKTQSLVQRISGIECYENKLYIFYDIMYPDLGYRTHITKVDMSSREIKTYRAGDFIDNEIPFIGKCIHLYNDFLISFCSSFVAIDVNKNLELNIFKNDSLKVSDNPILFFYKFKNCKKVEGIDKI